MASHSRQGSPALRAQLHQIGLCSEDPARLASFYGDALGYVFERAGAGFRGRGSDRRLDILPGASKTLAYAAYRLDDRSDLDALIGRLDVAGVAYGEADAALFPGGGVRLSDPDGNVFVFGLGAEVGGGVSDVPANARPARLQHVVFASTNADRLATFFVEVLGFRLSDRVLEDDELRTAFVRCSDEHHSLAVFGASQCRLDHHCYEAVEWNLIRDWADHFADLRIPLKWGPGRHGPGNNLFLFIHDPDGNWVELSAELEHCAPDREAGEWPHEERTLNSWGIGLLRK